MTIFFEGAIIGLTLALIMGFGPSFFTLIQTSISRGFKSAMLLDLGIVLNDIMIVALMMMTNVQFNIKGERGLIYAGISAGIILIIFGVYTYTLSPKKIIHISENNNAPELAFNYVGKTLSENGINLSLDFCLQHKVKVF